MAMDTLRPQPAEPRPCSALRSRDELHHWWVIRLSWVPWAAEWYRLRTAAGLDTARTSRPVPRPYRSGGFTETRLPTAGVATWLQKIITQLSYGADLPPLGTHSGETTLLSWKAKVGLTHSTRKLLRGHTEGKYGFLLLYSRDALADPMRQLDALVHLVQQEGFDPDCTRSNLEKNRDDSQLPGGDAARDLWSTGANQNICRRH